MHHNSPYNSSSFSYCTSGLFFSFSYFKYVEYLYTQFFYIFKIILLGFIFSIITVSKAVDICIVLVTYFHIDGKKWTNFYLPTVNGSVHISTRALSNPKLSILSVLFLAKYVFYDFIQTSDKNKDFPTEVRALHYCLRNYPSCLM